MPVVLAIMKFPRQAARLGRTNRRQTFRLCRLFETPAGATTASDGLRERHRAAGWHATPPKVWPRLPNSRFPRRRSKTKIRHGS